MNEDNRTPVEGNGEGLPVVIHTDGACHGNPGPGGWAAVIVRQDPAGEELIEAISGREAGTTNNRMELRAAIEGLNRLRPEWVGPVIVRSDAEYVCKGMTERLPRWIKQGWRTNDRKPVKNRDLWELLAEAAKGFPVEWQWVRGHSGNLWNEEADRLATLAALEVTQEVPA